MEREKLDREKPYPESVTIPWEPWPGETSTAYRAFIYYRDMGVDRTILATQEKLARNGHMARVANKRPSGRITSLSSQFRWLDRCRDWDRHLVAIRDNVRASVEAESAQKWERRRQQTLEQNWRISNAVQAKGEQMLATALTERTEEADGKVIVHKPAKWGFNTATDMLEFAVNLKAATLDAATRPTAELSPEELRAIASVPPGGSDDADTESSPPP